MGLVVRTLAGDLNSNEQPASPNLVSVSPGYGSSFRPADALALRKSTLTSPNTSATCGLVVQSTVSPFLNCSCGAGAWVRQLWPALKYTSNTGTSPPTP